MPRAPHEYLFRRKPFMERTVRDDVVALLAGLVGFTAGYLLIGDEQPWSFAFYLGTAVVVLLVGTGVRHAVRRRRDAASRMGPPD